MEYITLKEAVKLTGKSESTFRKVARKLKESNSKNIKLEKLPTGHDKLLFKLSYVNSHFLVGKTIESNKSHSANESTLEKVVSILERQLMEKDEHIKNLTQLLALEKQEKQLLIENPPKKKRWWQRGN
jgi:hypothetical protein